MRTNTRRPTRLRVERLEERAVPATFYVATNGADAAGGDAANPWRTLQHAADVVRAGDTVIVRAGDYAGFYLDTDGTAAARITFTGEAGARVTTRNPTTIDGINLEGADHVTVQGFSVIGMGRAGIRSVLNTGAVIRNNVCDSNSKWGILTGFSDDITIENNVCSRSAIEHGIYVSNSGDRPIVRGNTTWGNRANGIHMNGDIFSGGDGIISNALVENNVIYDNGVGGGSGINCDGVQNSLIRNNLIYNSHASGISLYRIDGGGASSGNTVVNNTVLVASDGRWALNIMNGATNTTARNNILYSAHTFRGAISITQDSLSGFVSDYNLTEDRFSADGGNSVLTLAQWRAATGRDANSFTTSDPNTLFVSPSTGDYHLKSNSAALDRGTTTGAPPTDAEGTARPSGSGVDIGHDELAVSPPPPPPPPPPPVIGQPFAVGTTGGTVAKVTLYNADRSVRFTATPFGGSYTGEVRVAVGDVTGDGVVDVVAVTSGSGSTAARAAVINGATGTLVSTPPLVPATYTGMLSVAVGDVNGDGTADVALGSNEGGPRARVYRGGDFATLADFRVASGTDFKGRTAIALGDLTGDGKADLIVSAWYANGSRVYGFGGTSLAAGVTPVAAFSPFTLTGSFGSGLHMAVGDMNADGNADLVLGSYGGVSPRVNVYSGKALVQSNTRTRIANFAPASASSLTGVRVAVRDTNGDGKLDLVTSSGEQVASYSGSNLPPSGAPPRLFTFDPDPAVNGGVWVG